MLPLYKVGMHFRSWNKDAKVHAQRILNPDNQATYQTTSTYQPQMDSSTFCGHNISAVYTMTADPVTCGLCIRNARANHVVLRTK